MHVTSGLSPEATKTSALSLIERACDQDEFINDGISPDLLKVNYIGIERDQTPPPSKAQETSSSNASMLAAALVPTAIVGAIAAFLIGKGKHEVKTETKTTPQEYDLQSWADESLSDASEDDWYRQPIYGRFNESSQIHDVHKCKSATCELCRRYETLKFIPAPPGSHLMTIDEGVEDT